MTRRCFGATHFHGLLLAAQIGLAVSAIGPAMALSPDAADDARLPRPRPDPTAPAALAKTLPERVPETLPEPAFRYGFRADRPLKAALDALDEKRYSDAQTLAARHGDPLVPELMEWLVARQPDSGLPPQEVVALLEKHPDWPDRERLALRAEQAFHALGPAGIDVLTFYSRTPPRTVGGNLALAGALRESGKVAEAQAIVRDLWREWPLASNQVAALLLRFGTLLDRDDHLYRFRRLVLNARTDEAVAQAEMIGPGRNKLARAVIAVIDRSSNGEKLLRAVAPSFSADPLYVFAKIRLLRRSGEPIEAARLLLQAEPDAKLAGDADIWWDERRDLSRQLLDRRTPDLAYKVAAGSKASGEAERAEAAFHAGWFALRFLDDPVGAAAHFRDLIALATLPRTRSRASYWLGRSFEANRQDGAAAIAYGEAARFGATFYGQLAREKIGMRTTGLERAPAPSALDRLRFADRDSVRAIRLLAAAGHAERTFPFFQALAGAINSPGEIALLAGLARRIEQPRAAMTSAAIAEQRGLPVASLAAPFLGVPQKLPMPAVVDRALVYSVVRQESAFNHEATSHVGARGLMQLMPATAKATAISAALPFSVQRLTTDPLYNATLGAYHLGDLLDRLDQSYVLTFVAYNAGPGRARDWVKAYGDLRGGTTDPVDWIERIPFDETRNYVQKVMENLQVYRSRSGHPLSLSKDLARGAPQG